MPWLARLGRCSARSRFGDEVGLRSVRADEALAVQHFGMYELVACKAVFHRWLVVGLALYLCNGLDVLPVPGGGALEAGFRSGLQNQDLLVCVVRVS